MSPKQSCCSFLLLLLFTFSTSNSWNNNKNTEYGIIDYVSDEFIILNCEGAKTSLAKVSTPIFDKMTNLKWVRLVECSLPNTSYEHMFTSLNINSTGIKELLLTSGERGHIQSHFEDLKILDLTIIHDEYVPIFNTSILIVIPSLRSLTCWGVSLPPLPKESQLQKLSLLYGQSLGLIGGCSNLQEIHLTAWHVNNPFVGWLKNCSKLVNVFVDDAINLGLSTEKLMWLLVASPSIRSIVITSLQDEVKNNTLDFGSISKYTNNLENLMLTNNKLQYVNFIKLPNLKRLVLKHNELKSLYVTEVLEHLPLLHFLDLSYNPGLDICDSQHFNDTQRSIGRLNAPGLEWVNASHSATSRLCFHNITANRIKNLNLRFSKIKKLELSSLPQTTMESLEVDLMGCEISDIRLNNSDCFLFDKTFLTLKNLNATIPCDSQNERFMRAVREGKLSIEGTLQCFNGTNISREWVHGEACNKHLCAPGCKCFCPCDDETNLICPRGSVTQIPHVENLRIFKAENNRINIFNASDLPKTLMELDLTNNTISRLDKSSAEVLFQVHERRIWLAGNPLSCDCDNQPLLNALTAHQNQVMDYQNVTCESGLHIADINIGALCALPLGLIIAGVLAILGLGVAIVAIYWRFERSFKIYLISHGLCLNWLMEEDIDSSCSFDAFISFVHADADIVIDKIIPKLEQLGFKLCIHYRDWVPGQFIPAQIALSVEVSRRTIIVVSKSFVKSTWGMLEFRTAFASFVQERRSRIIVVALDDVVDDVHSIVDGELKWYLTYNTYLKFSDPLFWNKIKFAISRSRVISPTEAEQAKL